MMKKSTTLFCLLFFARTLAAQNPGAAFFSAWQVHEIRFQFSQPGYFDSLKNNYALDVYMACEVQIDGATYPKSGVKYKGNSSYNNPSKKKPFRIDLAEFVSGQDHEGLKKLVLNNAFKDPTFLREKLMLDFLQLSGIPGPRATFARLYINDRYWGLYSVVEDVSKPFLESRFGNKNGNLFKGDPRGTLQWKGWDSALYKQDYELKTNENADDWSDLLRLLNALNNTPQTALPDSLDRYLNLDSWFSYWAAHNLFVNLDSYVGSGHNYFLYHNTTTDRFEWITWDVNEAFGNFSMGIPLQNLKNLPFTHIPQPMQSRPMMNRLLQIPTMKQRLADRQCQILKNFSNQKLDARIDSLAALIRPHVQADTLKFFTNAQFEQNLSQDLPGGGAPGSSGLAGLKPFIAARRTSLLGQLAAYGCAASSTAENADFQSVDIFPNPAAGSVFFKIPASDVPLSVSIFNPSGVLEKRFSFEKTGIEPLELSLAGLKNGLYFFKIERVGERTVVGKLLFSQP